MFSSEQELVDVLMTTISCRINTSHIFSVPESENVVISEVNLGFGIADVVVAGYKYYQDIDNKNSLDLISLSALFYLEEKKEASYYEISSTLCVRKEKLKCALDLLKVSGYIEYADNCWRIIKKYSNNLEYSLAIEAKLKNWKRALHQAYRYKWFSEKTFVCLPHQNVTPALKNIADFKDFEVGLMTVNPAGEVEVVYDPGTRPPVSPVLSGLLNEMASSYLFRSVCSQECQPFA